MILLAIIDWVIDLVCDDSVDLDYMAVQGITEGDFSKIGITREIELIALDLRP